MTKEVIHLWYFNNIFDKLQLTLEITHKVLENFNINIQFCKKQGQICWAISDYRHWIIRSSYGGSWDKSVFHRSQTFSWTTNTKPLPSWWQWSLAWCIFNHLRQGKLCIFLPVPYVFSRMHFQIFATC